MTHIDDSAFFGCNGLTTISIPASVTTIGVNAFGGCENLSAINVVAGNPNYSSIEGVLYDQHQSTLLQFPCGKASTFTTPSSVTTIGNYAFYKNTRITSVTMGNVTTVGSYAFSGCTGLSDISMPSTGTIGSYAFSGCTGLSDISMPSTGTIGSYAFSECVKLDTISLTSITTIRDFAFSGCTGLTSVTIPSSATTIINNAFSNCTSLTAINVNGSNRYYSSADGVLYDADKTTVVIFPCGKSGTFIAPESVTAIGGSFKGCTKLTAVSLPSVTSIGEYAFDGCAGLTSVSMPKVVSILEYAFNGCTGLTTIETPSTVTTLGSHAFSGCSGLTSATIVSATSVGDRLFKDCTALEEVTMTVSYIGYNTFEGCTKLRTATITAGSIYESSFDGCTALTSVQMSSVIEIGMEAFYGCTALTSVTIPGSVSSIGTDAFSNCSSLTSISVSEPNTHYTSDRGILYNNDRTVLIQCPGKLNLVTIPASVTTINDYAFRGCVGLTSITIPSTVTTIGNGVFYGCENLVSVRIESHITSIGNNMFYGCTKLSQVDVGTSVIETIGQCSFFGCTGLEYNNNFKKVTRNATSIEFNAFSGCSNLYDVELTNAIIIGENAFYECKNLGELELPEATTISYEAFSGCTGLTLVSMPNVTRVHDRAFYGCSNLSNVDLPKATALGRDAFSGCSDITQANIPEVTTIGDSAFRGCTMLNNVTMRSAISINDGAFSGCSSLEVMTIPSSVTSIGESVFTGCTKLTRFNVSLSNASYSSSNGMLYDDGKTVLICCPGGMTGAISIREGVMEICDGAFYGCAKITSVTLPSSVKRIGNEAFYGCAKITSLTIPSAVEYIGDDVFQGCSDLSEIVVDPDNDHYSSDDGILYDKDKVHMIFCPHGKIGAVAVPLTVRYISSGAMYSCTEITSVSMPSVYIVDNFAFTDSSGIVSVTAPSVMYIGNNAFSGCRALTTVSMPSVLYVGDDAFNGCIGLTSIDTFSNVTFIGNNAFSYCISLVSVDISSKVTNIGASAFTGCTKLTAIDVDEANVHYSSDGGILYDKGMTCLIQCPGGKAGAVSVPRSVTSITDYALYYCLSLEAINVDADNECYSSEAGILYDKSKTVLIQCPCGKTGEVTIPQSVIVIGGSAFDSNVGITSLTIPSSVESIEDYSLVYCESMLNINVNPENLHYSSDAGVLYNHDKTILLQYPSGRAGAFTIPSSVITINKYAFAGCVGLTSVTIPSSVTTIDYGVFYGCLGLRTIKMYSTPSQINDDAFSLGYEGHQAVCDVYLNSSTTGQLDPYTDDYTNLTYLPMVHIITYYDVIDGVLSETPTAYNPSTNIYGTETVLSDSPLKDGCGFGGWFVTSDCSGSAVTSLDGTVLLTDLTLYGKWTADTYTVTYDENYGSPSVQSQKTVTYGSPYVLPDDPSRAGYTFRGWFTAASGGNLVTSASIVEITANQTLYAKWTADTHTVTYDENYGSPSVQSQKAVTYDSPYVLPDDPSRTGYTFGGWFTAASGGNQVTSSTMVSIMDDQTLYAKWTANTYTVTYDENYGSPSATSQKAVTYDSPYVLPDDPSRAGYTFEGWFTTASGDIQVTSASIVKITTGQLLYAKWTANMYTVTYDESHGSPSAKSQKTVTYDSPYELPDVPSWTGYTFGGWYTVDGTSVTASTVVKITANQTLYAKWTVVAVVNDKVHIVSDDTGDVIVHVVDAVIDDTRPIVIGNASWELEMPSSVASGILADKDVVVSIGVAAAADVPPSFATEAAGKPILQLSMTVDGASPGDFSAPVTLKVKYDLHEGESTENMAVWCLGESSVVKYDATYSEWEDQGYLTFSVPHFSYWVVGQQDPAPSDDGFPLIYAVVGLIAAIAVAGAVFVFMRR